MIVIDTLHYVNWDRTILRALGESGGMFGFSLYPFHLKNGSNCKLEDFRAMAHKTADLMGIDHIGIGSDLCRHWDYSTLERMRSGRWTVDPDFGEGSSAKPQWPDQPSLFESASDIINIASGIKRQLAKNTVASSSPDGRLDLREITPNELKMLEQIESETGEDDGSINQQEGSAVGNESEIIIELEDESGNQKIIIIKVR